MMTENNNRESSWSTRWAFIDQDIHSVRQRSLHCTALALVEKLLIDFDCAQRVNLENDDESAQHGVGQSELTTEQQ